MKLPWKSFAAPESDGEYLVLLTYLPLNTFRATLKFFRYTREVQRQLAGSEGLICYSMEANVLSREYWTLSVWEGEESLRRFVERNPHGRIMRDLLPHMGQTAFIRWKVNGSSVPPNWEESKRRMRER